MAPSLSIITINFNNALGLKKTIESVLIQSIKDIEFIIIDGASTDESVAIIKDNELRLHYWISEKDTGIYHAMNKGISKATGKYLMFLNSGDCLVDKFTVEFCIDVIYKFPKVDIFYGDIYKSDKSDHVQVQNLWTHPHQLTLAFFKQTTINHQASLIRSVLFKEFGLYPLCYKLASDFWLFLIAFFNGKGFKHLGKPIVIFDQNGVSTTRRIQYNMEKNAIWESLVPKSIRDIIDRNIYLERVIEYKVLKVAFKINNLVQKVKSVFQRKIL